MGEREDGGGGGVDVMGCKWNKYFAKLWVGAKDCSSTLGFYAGFSLEKGDYS